MSKFKPMVMLIKGYKTRHFPFIPNKDYRHHLEGLMSELANLSTRPWRFEPERNYFISYCYVYLNPLKPGKFRYVCPSGRVLTFDFEPFYVGKGFKGRAWLHLEEALNLETHNHKVHTIREIWAAGKKPEVKVVSSRVSDFMACACEIDWIAGIGRRDLGKGPLTNRTDGGDGTSGHKHTKKTKRKMRASAAAKTPKEKLAITALRLAVTDFDAIGIKVSVAHGLHTLERKLEIQSKRKATLADQPSEKHLLRAARASKSMQLRNSTKPPPQVTCPDCGTTGSPRGINKRWHFGACL